MTDRVLMKGNEALAEAAIRAGCRHFFGYPITPQTELAAYMSKRMPKVGGTYLQAESEIAAINMVLGASAAGIRAMTSSSSPGISLKGEGISYMAGSDLPAVIINVQRGGPGSGLAAFFWVLQLALNFSWSLLFFGDGDYFTALLCLGLLWVFIFMMILAFHSVSRLAAWMQVPYFLWVSFAGYLNLVIWQLNP